MHLLATVGNQKRIINMSKVLEIRESSRTTGDLLAYAPGDDAAICIGIYKTTQRCNEVVDFIAQSLLSGITICHLPEK